MQLYTIFFDDTVSYDDRIAVAQSIESTQWEVERRWIPADPYSGNLNIDSLLITNWFNAELPLPKLPTGCILKKF